MADRVILHCDLNNFFASVECRGDPALRKIPVAVCGSVEERHGIVLAKNEAAKRYGVQTAEAVWEARRKCPQLRIVPPHYGEYMRFSQAVRAVYERYTDRVEPFGIDECWLDMTGCTELFGSGEQIAQTLRRTVREELGLTISVGVSFNKVFAKLGSDLRKPDAVTAITRANYRRRVWPLPAGALLGVGRATARALASLGILTVGDIAGARPEVLRRSLGKNGEALWRNARGLDVSPVIREQEQPPVKSVGRSVTCIHDLTRPEEVHRVFLALAERVGAELREEKLLAGMIQISIRDSELHTKEHQRRLEQPVRLTRLLAGAAEALFDEFWDWALPVRALGIRACDLIGENDCYQLSFAYRQDEIEQTERLEQNIGTLRRKYGRDAVMRASLLSALPFSSLRDEPSA